jgi:hypothetical protein
MYLNGEFIMSTPIVDGVESSYLFPPIRFWRTLDRRLHGIEALPLK